MIGGGSDSLAPDTRTEKFKSLEGIYFDRYVKSTEGLTYVTHVNGWKPAVYMSYMSENFSLFHPSNISVLNFRNILLM